MPVQAGKAGGLTALLGEHQGELLRFLRARCGTSEEAEDCLQELWLKAGAATPGPLANGRAYLFQMANNLALDRVRQGTRRMRRDLAWLDTDAGVVQERPDPTPDAEARLLADEELAMIHTAIDALPESARRALVLYRIEGHGQGDVARMMGISRSGVEKHLALAMRRLRQHLTDCGYFETVTSEGQGGDGISDSSGDEKR